MEIFKGWYSIFTKTVHSHIIELLKNPNNPFNFFEPENTKIIIIVNDENFEELKYKEDCSIISSNESKSLNFKNWAIQGILLLNLYTSDQSIINEWKDFNMNILKRFPNVLCFSTEELKGATLISKSERLLNHFDKINCLLLSSNKNKIIWNNGRKNFAFTDGGCSKNGKKNAVASFSALIEGVTVRGIVKPFEYKFVDEKNLEKGICIQNVKVQPSNNRGELLGLVYGFLSLLIEGACGEINVWTDSKICVNTLLTWLPNRLKKGTEKELKNFDLIMIAWKLLNALRNQAIIVNIHHINSHTKEPPLSAPKSEKFIWRGNFLADKNASLALSEGIPINIINGSEKLKKILIE